MIANRRLAEQRPDKRPRLQVAKLGGLGDVEPYRLGKYLPAGEKHATDQHRATDKVALCIVAGREKYN